jgi:hypothetical protein
MDTGQRFRAQFAACERWLFVDSSAMSAQEVIEQFKHLPPAERAQVTKFVVENDDS